MRVISLKKLRLFWKDPRNAGSEASLRAWYQVVKASDWTCFADVRKTYNTADLVGNKVVFDAGGNKYRVIAVIDYEGHKVFLRFVLSHQDYDKGLWKSDTFGQNWRPRSKESPESRKAKGRPPGGAKPCRRKGRSKK